MISRRFSKICWKILERQLELFFMQKKTKLKDVQSQWHFDSAQYNRSLCLIMKWFCKIMNYCVSQERFKGHFKSGHFPKGTTSPEYVNATRSQCFIFYWNCFGKSLSLVCRKEGFRMSLKVATRVEIRILKQDYYEIMTHIIMIPVCRKMVSKTFRKLPLPWGYLIPGIFQDVVNVVKSHWNVYVARQAWE